MLSNFILYRTRTSLTYVFIFFFSYVGLYFVIFYMLFARDTQSEPITGRHIYARPFAVLINEQCFIIITQ